MRTLAMFLVLSVVGCGSAKDVGHSSSTAALSTPRTPGSPSAPRASVKPDRPGCNSTKGVQCNGDWQGKCTPACADSQCCSPANGTFRCVDVGADGYCPAADIFVDTTRIAGATTVEWREFPPDDCAIVEGCVSGSGQRRLLRFDTFTPNRGASDLFLGDPTTQPQLFEYSACHMHYHFNSYASYELRRADGSIAARGHKQSFCLEDLSPYPTQDDSAPPFYTCDNQGIQVGWGDLYDQSLDCQWVDITDVPAGDYALQIALNTEHLLSESNYDNDVATILVTIPADDSGTRPDSAP